MTNKLKNVTVEEISLVSRPAINRQFLLWKSMDSDNVAKAKPMEEDEEVEETEEHEGSETPEEEAIEEAALEAAKKKGKKKGGKMVEKAEVTEVTETISKAQVDELITKALAEKDAKIADLEKAAADEKVRLTKEQEELKKALEAEKTARVTKEFVELAKAEVSSLPGTTPEAFGPVLKEMKDVLAEGTYTTVYGILKSASEYIAKNDNLTKELGTSGTPTGNTAGEKLDAIAKSYIAKDVGMSHAKALVKACQDNPELYKEYNTEYSRGA